MDSPSFPAPPDPLKTAQAQSQMNKETAISQYGLAATNQKTPYGNLSYQQIGAWPDGTPRYESTMELGPEQKGLFDLGTQTQKNIGQIGVEQSARIGNLLNQPINLSNEATESRLMELGRKRLDPLVADRRSGLETQLINKGVRPGSLAYDRATGNLGQQENDLYNQLLLTGRGTATQEALTERNQPINEITALLSGSQVQQPNFRGTPTPGVAPTDFIGAQNMAYQGEIAKAQAEQKQQQALMQGLFGLGSTALGGWMMSDKGTKKDIKKVGKTDDGLPLYTYRYKDDPGGLIQFGLMAQDVEKKIPDAVAEVDGTKFVNYSRVAEELSRGG